MEPVPASQLAEKSQITAKSLYDSLPEGMQKEIELGRETVQTVVWVVGLTGTLLVFIGTNPIFLSGLPHYLRVALCVSLGATAGVGVLQRMVSRNSEIKYCNLMYSFSAYLYGFMNGPLKLIPLIEGWNRDSIITQLQKITGADYTFFNTNNVPLEQCKTHYNEIYEIYKKADDDAYEELSQVVLAYENKPAKKIPSFEPVDRETFLAEIRTEAKLVHRWELYSNTLFYATCSFFIFSAIGVTIAAALRSK